MKTKVLIILLLFSYTMYGQDDTYQKDKEHHYVGIGLGITTGYGLSYRYLSNKFGFQVNYAPFYYRNEGSAFSLGGTVLYKFNESENKKLLIYFSNTLLSSKSIHRNLWGLEDSENFNTGLGLDVEFFTTQKFVMNVMGGFQSYNSFEKITFTWEIGFHYRIQ